MHAVVFDLDGTLVDTIPLIVEGMNVAVQPVIGRTLSSQEVIGLFGPIEFEMIRRVVGDAEASRAARRFFDHYARGLAHAGPYPGVCALLDELQRQGVRMGIVTGKGGETARLTLDALDLVRYFEVVLGGDCGFDAKPEPGCLLEALRVLGAAASDTLLVGDSRNDLVSARAAGVHAGLAAWDLHTGSIEDLAPLADYVFQRPAEVLAWI